MKDAGVYLESLVKKIVLAVYLHQADDLPALFLGPVVDAAALLPRVGVSVQAHVRDDAGPVPAYRRHQLAIYPQRHGVGRDLILAARPADSRRHAQVRRNERVDDALVLYFGHAAAVLHEVAGRHAGDDGQCPGRPLFAEAFAHSFQDRVRRGERAETAHTEGHAVVHELHGLGGRYDLSQIYPPFL